MKITDITTLFTGYDRASNFRILINANDKDAAQRAADKYVEDSNFNLCKMTVAELTKEDLTKCFDCDYVVSPADETDSSVYVHQNNDINVYVRNLTKEDACKAALRLACEMLSEAADTESDKDFDDMTEDEQKKYLEDHDAEINSTPSGIKISWSIEYLYNRPEEDDPSFIVKTL